MTAILLVNIRVHLWLKRADQPVVVHTWSLSKLLAQLCTDLLKFNTARRHCWASSLSLCAFLPDSFKADAYLPIAHIDSANIAAKGLASTFFDLSKTSSTYDRVRKPVMLARVSIHVKISGNETIGWSIWTHGQYGS